MKDKNPPSEIIEIGNAINDGFETRGWFIGAFIDSKSKLRTTNDVEVKWGEHPAGEVRESKAEEGNATSLSILIEGDMGIKFKDREEIRLNKKGDYIIWNPNISHSTIAYQYTLIITVRWPSLSAKKN